MMEKRGTTSPLTRCFLATSVAIIGLSSCSTTLALSVGGGHGHHAIHTHRVFQKQHIRLIPGRHQHHKSSPSCPPLCAINQGDDDNEGSIPQQQTSLPLCDLQTFLRMCDLVDSGGKAKTAIQNSECKLNGEVETRRSKKLFPGDLVSFGKVVDLDVATEVKKKGYVYKPKEKKVKPLAKVDADGNLEFGGRFRSDEWRAERKLKKAERKTKNQDSKK